MQIPNYYQRLGVAETATADEIKREFRRLAKELHPDRNPGDKAAEARFKELSEAYDVLSDTEKRREYDQIRKSGSFDDVLRSRRQRESGHQNFDFHVDDSMSFEELFGSLFGNSGTDPFSRRGGPVGRTRTQTRRARGRDVETSLEIPMLAAIRGGKQRVTLPDGRTLDIAIPVGVESGNRIRLAGQGEQLSGTASGDLYLQIAVAPDSVYDRHGNDIVKKIQISLKTALLGGSRTETFLDREIRLAIPPLTAPGTKLRLRGLGIHDGDGYVEITVLFPTALSDKAKALAEELPS